MRIFRPASWEGRHGSFVFNTHTYGIIEDDLNDYNDGEPLGHLQPELGKKRTKCTMDFFQIRFDRIIGLRDWRHSEVVIRMKVIVKIFHYLLLEFWAAVGGPVFCDAKRMKTSREAPRWCFLGPMKYKDRSIQKLKHHPWWWACRRTHICLLPWSRNRNGYICSVFRNKLRGSWVSENGTHKLFPRSGHRSRRNALHHF